MKEAPVAQLDRASDYGSEGCKFESCRVRHKKSPRFYGDFFMVNPVRVRTYKKFGERDRR